MINDVVRQRAAANSCGRTEIYYGILSAKWKRIGALNEDLQGLVAHYQCSKCICWSVLGLAISVSHHKILVVEQTSDRPRADGFSKAARRQQEIVSYQCSIFTLFLVPGVCPSLALLSNKHMFFLSILPFRTGLNSLWKASHCYSSKVVGGKVAV